MPKVAVAGFMLLILVMFSALMATPASATPPYPSLGLATVDSNAGEGDLFANMYRAWRNNGMYQVESRFYLRHNCFTHTLYALVLCEPGVTACADQPGEASIKIDSSSPPPHQITLVDGNSPNFAWVNQSGDPAEGWEASAYLPEGSYSKLRVHTEVNDDGEQTSSNLDKDIPLEIHCPSPPVPEAHTIVLISSGLVALGGFLWFRKQRRHPKGIAS